MASETVNLTPKPDRFNADSALSYVVCSYSPFAFYVCGAEHTRLCRWCNKYWYVTENKVLLSDLIHSIGMVMDWRELAGYPTAPEWQRGDSGSPFGDIWSGGQRIESHELSDLSQVVGTDPIRGWIIAICWLIASGAE
jgi:hypothetical protein